jgi:hypothetical protein
MKLISLLSDNQIKHGAMWKSFSSTNFVVARRDVSELYYRYKTTPSSDESDRYKAAVLALISGSEQIGRSSQVLSTVDDFMFASLWHAVYSDQNTVESIAKMGNYLDTHTFSMDELMNIAKDNFGNDLQFNFEIDGLQEKSSCMYSFDTPVGKMGGKITDWTIDDDGIPLSDSNRRGILMENGMVMPFFEYYGEEVNDK